MKKIISWSGGKDSTASIIIAHEQNEQIDTIIFSEVMFDEHTSGELPEHMEFVHSVAIPTFEKWGYNTIVLRHDRTYMDYFNHRRMRGGHVGKRVGFPMSGHCNVQNCKIRPIAKYLASLDEEYEQIVGIASDEPLRLARLSGGKSSLLAKYGITETESHMKCQQYGLLSPYYNYSCRGGCWFCPNARMTQLRHLYRYHPYLWNKLLLLEKEEGLVGNIWDTRGKRSITELTELFNKEE